MPEISIDALDGLTARDVVHAKMSATEADATVADLRDFFAASSSRRLAVLVDGGRYRGEIRPEGIPDDADGASPAIALATPGQTVAADAPASAARDLALATDALRVAVLDDTGTLLGVAAIDKTRSHFCGT